jgi:hypothetical protein
LYFKKIFDKGAMNLYNYSIASIKVINGINKVMGCSGSGEMWWLSCGAVLKWILLKNKALVEAAANNCCIVAPQWKS